jgi:hypothetical protein
VAKATITNNDVINSMEAENNTLLEWEWECFGGSGDLEGITERSKGVRHHFVEEAN